MKKLLSVLIVSVMMMSLLSVGVLAEGDDTDLPNGEYKYESLTKTIAVKLGEQYVYLGKQPTFETAEDTTPAGINGFTDESLNSTSAGAGNLYFNPETATLTANNITAAQIVSYWGSFTINFEGENIIDNGTGAQALATNHSTGIYGSTGYVDDDDTKDFIYNALIIGGSGSVTISGGNYTLMSKFGDMVFKDSVSVDVKCTGANPIHVSALGKVRDSTCSLYIIDAANLAVTESTQHGIRMAGGMLYIDTEGTVDLKYTATANWGYPIILYRGCDFVMRAGTINIDYETKTQAAGGIYLSGDSNIVGGEINIKLVTTYTSNVGRLNGFVIKDEAGWGAFEVNIGGDVEINIEIQNATESVTNASGVFLIQSSDQTQGITLNVLEDAVIDIKVSENGTPGAIVNQKNNADINLEGGAITMTNVGYIISDTSPTKSADISVTGTKLEAETLTGLFSTTNMVFEYPEDSEFLAMIYGEAKENTVVDTEIDVNDTEGLKYFRTLFMDDFLSADYTEADILKAYKNAENKEPATGDATIYVAVAMVVSLISLAVLLIVKRKRSTN